MFYSIYLANFIVLFLLFFTWTHNWKNLCAHYFALCNSFFSVQFLIHFFGALFINPFPKIGKVSLKFSKTQNNSKIRPVCRDDGVFISRSGAMKRFKVRLRPQLGQYAQIWVTKPPDYLRVVTKFRTIFIVPEGIDQNSLHNALFFCSSRLLRFEHSPFCTTLFFVFSAMNEMLSTFGFYWLPKLSLRFQQLWSGRMRPLGTTIDDLFVFALGKQITLGFHLQLFR